MITSAMNNPYKILVWKYGNENAPVEYTLSNSDGGKDAPYVFLDNNFEVLRLNEEDAEKYHAQYNNRAIVWTYRDYSEMTAIELREKAQQFISKFFKVADTHERLAVHYLEQADKHYKLAQMRG